MRRLAEVPGIFEFLTRLKEAHYGEVEVNIDDKLVLSQIYAKKTESWGRGYRKKTSTLWTAWPSLRPTWRTYWWLTSAGAGRTLT